MHLKEQVTIQVNVQVRDIRDGIKRWCKKVRIVHNDHTHDHATLPEYPMAQSSVKGVVKGRKRLAIIYSTNPY